MEAWGLPPAPQEVRQGRVPWLWPRRAVGEVALQEQFLRSGPQKLNCSGLGPELGVEATGPSRCRIL